MVDTWFWFKLITFIFVCVVFFFFLLLHFFCYMDLNLKPLLSLPQPLATWVRLHGWEVRTSSYSSFSKIWEHLKSTAFIALDFLIPLEMCPLLTIVIIWMYKKYKSKKGKDVITVEKRKILYALKTKLLKDLLKL